MKAALVLVGLAAAILSTTAHAGGRASIHLHIGVPAYAYQPPVLIYPAPVYRAGYGHHWHGGHYHRGWRADQDGDGVPNRYDRDRDSDGVPNRFDRRPHNPWQY